MLYGIAKVNIGTNALGASSLFGENIAFDQCVAGLTLEATTNFVEAKCQINGILQTVASAINAEDFMLNLTYEFLDWNTLQLLYGELSKTGGAAVPTTQDFTITAAGAVTVPGLTAVNAASVRVYDNTQAKFLKLDPTTAGADEFVVNGASGTVSFNASQIGSVVTIRYDRIYTSISSIGLTGPTDFFTDLNLVAIVSSAVDGAEAYVLVVDKMERTNTPTLTLEGDKAVFNIQYKALVKPGQRKPFKMYRLKGAI